MHAEAPFISMPPSNAAWSLMHSRRELAIAFTLSAALHLFAWLATPYFIQAWREPAIARFDAVLVPIVDSPAVSAPAPKVNTKRISRTAKTVAPKPAPAPRSNAHFAAPENALAVDRSPEAGDENTAGARTASDEKIAMTAGSNPNSPDPPPIAEATPPPLAAEQKEPDPPSPELPSRISIAYKMTSSISDGVADYAWTRDGDRFEIDSSMQATGFRSEA